MTSFVLSVSYSQVAVFVGALDNPFSSWTERHVNQGFAWRAGSVSFGTLEGGGRHVVDVVVATDDAELSREAARIIDVPFEVPASGVVEVASIADGFSLELPSGMYALRFECIPRDGRSQPRIRLVFTRRDNPTFAILRADGGLSVSGELLLTAQPG